MIRHVVLLKFRADVDAAARAGLMAELDALCGLLPGVAGFVAHRNVSPEAPVTHGFDDGFVIDLYDAAARDAYLADPRHVAIGAKLTAACAGGTAGIVVFDHVL